MIMECGGIISTTQFTMRGNIFEFSGNGPLNICVSGCAVNTVKIV